MHLCGHLLAAFCENMIDAHHVLAGSCVRDQREVGGEEGKFEKNPGNEIGPAS